MEQYYVDIEGQTAGPFSVIELGDLLRAGRVNGQTLFAKPNSVEWMPLSLILPILPVAKPPPLAPPVVPPVDTRIRARRSDWVCTRCGHVGATNTETPGSVLIELILWLFFLIPGIIYSIWRGNKRHRVCRQCGVGVGLIPATAPNAQAWVVTERVKTEFSWGVAVLLISLPTMLVVFTVFGEVAGTMIFVGVLFAAGFFWLAVNRAKARRQSREMLAEEINVAGL